MLQSLRGKNSIPIYITVRNDIKYLNKKSINRKFQEVYQNSKAVIFGLKFTLIFFLIHVF